LSGGNGSAAIAPGRPARLIGPGRYRRRAYGANHPLAIPRVALARDLIEAYRAITPGEVVAARKAADFELEWFHARDYVAAIKRAEQTGKVKPEYREQYALGTLENPYFDHFFTTPATATGASIQAAEEVLAGRVAFNPAGGMHHARPARAQGFCYFNDPVLAVMCLRRAGWRVLYVDIDAHHCDGVEDAFREDPGTLTLSLHMDTAYAYPGRGGRLEDAGSAAAGHTTVNVPLPHALTDAEYRVVFDTVWPNVLARFRPDAIVLQAGTDMLAGDPLGKWRCATQTFLSVCARIVDDAPRHADGTPRVLATGGGGYHPLLVARAWTGLWGILSGRRLPEALPAAGAALLRGVEWEHDEEASPTEPLLRARVDEVVSDSIRAEVRALAERVLTHPFFGPRQL
jgi:acetoin utilization protein AcuC